MSTNVLPGKEALQVHAESGIGKKSSQADEDIALEASLKTTGLGSADVVEDNSVPIIDMSAGDEGLIADELWEAATRVGFFTLVGHGIDQALIDAAFDASASFFSQPLEEKKRQSPLDVSVNCGFEHFAQIRPSTGVADQKESLQITARKGAMDDRWPNTEFQDVAEKFLQAANSLARRVLDLLEPRAVPDASGGTLANSHNPWGNDCQCTLRFLHYPPLEDTSPLLKDGYWRAGPHTDWANVTLLFQRLGQNGLECCANPRTGNPHEMYWTAVNPIPGGIAVNIGDMLARWSDGRLHSNLHRVRLPTDASKSRYSIAYFAQSDKETRIESRNSEPITAGDYILSRVKSNYSKGK